ncbi:MAG: ABC transporter ATP-binding protein [Pseudomonadota bacterium]
MIELHNLGFSYRRTTSPLFNNLNLSLPAGTICGLLGPNGAGKSTLLKVLSGLAFPRQGTCRVMGADPAQREPTFLADIFLLHEEIFVPPIPISTYLARYAALYPKFDFAVFDKIVSEFELDLKQKLNNMSQGQRKKFLLAFGIATNTRLLLMDEPTNGLDIRGKSQFRKILVAHYDSDRSFLISTHQMHDLDGLIDSLAIISNGKILLHETMDSLASRLSVSIETRAPIDALYFEETLEGFAVVRTNPTGIEGRLDLGLLYGMVTAEHATAQSTTKQDVRR